MKLMVTSWRGHHEAVVDDPTISKAVFEKMTGLNKAALPADMKVKIPDTFQELEGLWRDGPMGYTAVAKRVDGMEVVKEFDPLIEDLLFLAPIVGG
jgi:hypothetical protein